MSSFEIPCDRRLVGSIEVPPSKSVTHRFLLLSLLCEAPVRIDRPLIADDTLSLIGALRACGRHVGWDGDRLISAPGSAEGSSRGSIDAAGHREASGGGAPSMATTIDCGASGTLLRLLLGVLATRPGRWVLDGVEQLRRRPVGPLVDALRDSGASIAYSGVEGFAPLSIEGRPSLGGRVALDASLSSQYLSALILAGVGSERGLEVEVRGLVSAPYVELTSEAVRRFGGRVEVDGSLYRMRPGVSPPQELSVEADFSAAAYLAAAAVLTRGDVRLLGLSPTSTQGDRRFLAILEAMGATVEATAAAIRVRGGERLEGIDADMADMPDQVPTLAALAPFARGVTRISGVRHVRLKESDRLAAMATELIRVGATAQERADGLEIPGVWARGAAPSWSVIVEPHDDHRIAMSMAVLGLRRCGVSVGHPEVVNKSFPGFWTALEALCATGSPIA